jgi:ribosomal protein L40E
MYHDDPNHPPVCIWCGGQNPTPLVLCPACEYTAQTLRTRKGEPIRENG